MFMPNFWYCGASLGVLKTALMESLKAKFRACVGKYRRTLAKLPLQNGMTPSFLKVLRVKSTTPIL